MDNVIYSATPLRAFSGGLILIAFLFGLGIIGAGWALFKKEKPLPRIAMGCSALVLLLAALGTSIVFVQTIKSGDKTVTVLLNEKKEVVSNCDSGTCRSYLLETHAGTKAYDFTVAKSAWDIAEVGVCYQVTYYPSQSLFGEYFQEQDISEFYEASSTITRVEKVNCQ